MLRYASTQARQALLLNLLAPSLKRSLIRCYSIQPQTTQQDVPTLTPRAFSHSIRPPTSTSSGTNFRDTVHGSLNIPAEKSRVYNETIAAIRISLGNGQNAHNPRLLKLWETLDELKVVDMLGYSQLKPLSDLMIRTFLEGEQAMQKVKREPGGEVEGQGSLRIPTMKVIEPQLREMVHNITLMAAKCDSWDAMDALLRYFIRQEEPQAISDLYSRFTALVGGEKLKEDSMSRTGGGLEDEEYEGGNGMGEEDLVTTAHLDAPIQNIGQTHLLVAVISAHAMKNDFRGALDACIKTSVQLERATAQRFISVAFGHDTTLQNEVQQYLDRIMIAKLVSRPRVFSSRVHRLGVDRSPGRLMELYEGVRNGLEGETAFLAADPSLVTSTKTIALTSVGWTTLLSAFLKCERKDWASQLWNDMLRFGVPPGVSMWTALIDAYGSIAAGYDAIAAWDMMIRAGVEPDLLACRAIVSALFRSRRPEHAMQMFTQFRGLPLEKSANGIRRLSFYNTVLDGLCSADKREIAERLREEMEKDGPKPDMVTYNTFIKYYGRRGQFKGVATTLRAMQVAGFQGDVFTYTTILSALLKAGKKDAAELVLGLMDKQGVKRNGALYSLLIDAQLREGQEANLLAALDMLGMMEKDKENPPNEVTYTSVLHNLYRMNWLEPEDLVRLETDILRRMKQRGIQLSIPAYHLLLKMCLVCPREHGVQRAIGYYEEMKSRELPFTNQTWYILLAGLLGREQWAAARRIVKEMADSGVYPTGTLLRMVEKVRVGPKFGD